MMFEEPSRDLQRPWRRHAGDDVGSSAAGPKPGRDSFTPKLAGGTYGWRRAFRIELLAPYWGQMRFPALRISVASVAFWATPTARPARLADMGGSQVIDGREIERK